MYVVFFLIVAIAEKAEIKDEDENDDSTTFGLAFPMQQQLEKGLENQKEGDADKEENNKRMTIA